MLVSDECLIYVEGVGNVSIFEIKLKEIVILFDGNVKGYQYNIEIISLNIKP